MNHAMTPVAIAVTTVEARVTHPLKSAGIGKTVLGDAGRKNLNSELRFDVSCDGTVSRQCCRRKSTWRPNTYFVKVRPGIGHHA